MQRLQKSFPIALSAFAFCQSAAATDAASWYTKVEGSYAATASNVVHIVTLPDGSRINDEFLKAKARGPIFSLGLGYNFTTRFRSDITASAKTGFRASVADTYTWSDEGKKLSFSVPYKETVTTNLYAGMINFSYDLLSLEDVSPYVTFGLGAENFREQWTLDGTGTVSLYGIPVSKVQSLLSITDIGSDGKPDTRVNKRLYSKRATRFAGQVGGGLVFKTSDTLYLDITYKALAYNKTDYSNPFAVALLCRDTSVNPGVDTWMEGAVGTYNASSAFTRKSLQHSISLGLRFML